MTLRVLGSGLAAYFFALSSALAQSAANSGAAQAAARPGLQDMLVPVAGFIFVFYFLVMRPQQKKLKQQQDLLKNLKRGDEVVTNGGVLGEITNITDKIVTIQVAEDVRIKIVRSQIAGLTKEGIS